MASGRSPQTSPNEDLFGEKRQYTRGQMKNINSLVDKLISGSIKPAEVTELNLFIPNLESTEKETILNKLSSIKDTSKKRNFAETFKLLRPTRVYELVNKLVSGLIRKPEKDELDNLIVTLPKTDKNKILHKLLLENDPTKFIDQIKSLLEGGARINDKFEIKNVLNREIKNLIKIYSQFQNKEDCSDFISDQSILFSTSDYAGFELCPLKAQIKTFLEGCVCYYSNVDTLNEIKKELLRIIKQKKNDLGNYDFKKTNGEIGYISLRNELDLLLKRYEYVKNWIPKEQPNNTLQVKGAISKIFTSWMKFLMPIPGPDSQINKQAVAVLVQLMNNSLKDKIEKYNPLSNDTVYDKLLEKKCIRGNKIIKKMDTLKQIVCHMVFKLATPSDVFYYKIEILQRYRIFKIKEIFSPKIENQNILLSLIEEFNVKSLEDKFTSVYRVPINVVDKKITINIPSEYDDDPDLLKMRTGILTLTALMRAPINPISGSEAINVTETSRFRETLSKTDEKRAGFLFLPTEFMFSNEAIQKPTDFYTFMDILCGQYFSEYKYRIDKEHIITASKLRYLTDYAVTFKGEKNEDAYFDLFISIFEFALRSYFVQIYVTDICNVPAGTKIRWDKTIERYRNLLTFVCELYWCKLKNLDSSIYIKFEDDDNGAIGADSSGSIMQVKSVSEYINLMYKNSLVFSEKTNMNDSFKKQYLEYPTIILPEDFITDVIFDKELDPIKVNYEIVSRIGMSMSNYLGNVSLNKEEIQKTINTIFINSENIFKYHKLQDRIEKKTNELQEYKYRTPIEEENRNDSDTQSQGSVTRGFESDAQSQGSVTRGLEDDDSGGSRFGKSKISTLLNLFQRAGIEKKSDQMTQPSQTKIALVDAARGFATVRSSIASTRSTVQEDEDFTSLPSLMVIKRRVNKLNHLLLTIPQDDSTMVDDIITKQVYRIPYGKNLKQASKSLEAVRI